MQMNTGKNPAKQGHANTYSDLDESVTKTDDSHDGFIRFPKEKERIEGGHAIVLVGYDDNDDRYGGDGSFIIRNSWGTSWGNEGYGRLPYDYVLRGLADDFWAITSYEWIDTGNFQ